MRLTLLLMGGLLLEIAPALGEINPVKLAREARFDLLGDMAVGALTNEYMLTGEAYLARQTWLDPAEQPRSFTVNFPIAHFGWLEGALRFTPASNGVVTLSLKSPYEEAQTGVLYRQEVLWDACFASGAVLTNGGFETVVGGRPAGWARPFGDATVVTDAALALAGTRFVRTWHDGPLEHSFSVTGGLPVTLRLSARAVLPAGVPDQPRLLGTNTPAHQAVLGFMRGVNLGNYLEAPPGQDWGARYSTNDFVQIRNEGFDHVRLPLGWHFHTGPGPAFAVSNSFFAQANFLVTNALNRGLGVLVNIHNYEAFSADPAAQTNKFYAIWRQIAAHYSNYPPSLAFELINEPHGAATTDVLNPIYAEAIRQIRLSNPSRTIFVGPGLWNGIPELGRIRLPAADSNLVVTVHCYDPFLYTHQGAGWIGRDVATVGLRYPGPPPTPLAPAPNVADWVTNWIADYNRLPADGNPSSRLAFENRLKWASAWAGHYGRPVHIGEFGAYSEFSDVASRARFYHEFRELADALGLAWAMWDWKAGFFYWDDSAQRPGPGMRDAIFPPFKLNATGPGQFHFDGAVAKTYVVQRASSLIASGTSWTNLRTQTLSTPTFQFTDPASVNTTGSFYRVFWKK